MNIYYKKLIKLPIVIYAVLFSIVTMADYSIAIGYEPKYSDSFRHFDYVNTKSKQGGTIKLSAFGTFESLNPFLLKSLAPTGLTNLVFETLMERSLDEPSSSYGHIASKYRLSEDKLSVIYYIKDNAYFSNGDEITAKDVEFSYKTLVSKDAHPQYKIYWSDIKDVIVLDRKSIKFIFNQ